MATANTLRIKNIGRIEAERFVNTPGRGLGATRAIKVKRMFPQHTIGKVVHDGANGPRIGRFPKEKELQNAAGAAVAA
jgi:hypothetical protein